MSRLFDLEQEVLKAQKIASSRTFESRNYIASRRRIHTHFKRRLLRQNRVFKHSQELGIYAGQLGLQEHIGLIESINAAKTWGKIRDEEYGILINFSVADNVLSAVLENKEELQQLLKEGTAVKYTVNVMPNEKIESVHGRTLDLLEVYEVKLTSHTISEFGGQDTLKQKMFEGDNVLKFNDSEDAWYMTIDTQEYPHVSKAALKRYEIEHGDLGEHSLAMKMTRGSFMKLQLYPDLSETIDFILFTPGMASFTYFQRLEVDPLERMSSRRLNVDVPESSDTTDESPLSNIDRKLILERSKMARKKQEASNRHVNALNRKFGRSQRFTTMITETDPRHVGTHRQQLTYEDFHVHVFRKSSAGPMQKDDLQAMWKIFKDVGAVNGPMTPDEISRSLRPF